MIRAYCEMIVNQVVRFFNTLLAQAFLEGQPLDWPELEKLVKQLKGDQQFATARAVLLKAKACAWPTDARADNGNQSIADLPRYPRSISKYACSTFALAQGVLLRNFRLDLMLGSWVKQRIGTAAPSASQP